MQGEWLGGWPGEWFGDAGEPDPNAISGTAAVSVTATGTLEAASGAMSGAASLSITATASAVQPDASGGALAGLREAIRRDAENRRKQREAEKQAEQVREFAELEAIANVDALKVEAGLLQVALSEQIAVDAISAAMTSAADADRKQKNRNRAAMLAALMLLE